MTASRPCSSSIAHLKHLNKRNETTKRRNHARIDGTLYICIGNKCVGQLVSSPIELANLDTYV